MSKEAIVAKPVELVFMDAKLGEPFTTSETIATHSGNSRHAVQVLIEKYVSDFREFGPLSFEMSAVKRPEERGTKYIKVYHLNEEQATLLLTYLKNTPKVRAFKKELVRQFFEMRRLLLERQSEQWKQARSDGKSVRRLETDAIKAFVEYAAANGSKHPEKYYTCFTTLARKAIGVEKCKRDLLPAAALINLQIAEQVISLAIWSELAAGTEYHSAFQNVKAKVQQVSELAFAPIPAPQLAQDSA